MNDKGSSHVITATYPHRLSQTLIEAFDAWIAAGVDRTITIRRDDGSDLVYARFVEGDVGYGYEWDVSSDVFASDQQTRFLLDRTTKAIRDFGLSLLPLGVHVEVADQWINDGAGFRELTWKAGGELVAKIRHHSLPGMTLKYAAQPGDRNGRLLAATLESASMAAAMQVCYESPRRPT